MQILSLKRLILTIFVLMTCANHTHVQAQPQVQVTTCSTKGVIMCAWWDRITRDLHDDITILVLTQTPQNPTTNAFTAAIRADVEGCAKGMGETLLPNNPAGAVIQEAILAYFDAGFAYLNTLTTTGTSDQSKIDNWSAQGTSLAEITVFLLTGIGPVLPGPTPIPNPVFLQLNGLIQTLIGVQVAEMNVYNTAARNGTATFGPDGINDAFLSIQKAGEIGFFIGELAL